jgi:CRP/FNR family transcriptional regulator
MRPDVLASALHHQDPLPAEHPCLGCEVRSLAVCGVLDAPELAQLKGLGWQLNLSAGQPLFHEGDPAPRVFTLTSGTLKLYKLLPDGRRQVTGFMYPGDFLGISVADEHAFTAEALGPSQLCWFARNRFDDFMDGHPEMERELYRLAAHELAAAQQQMVLLGRKSAAERMASFLIMLAEKAQRRLRQTRFVELPMTRTDIADYLGLTKETVSRVLSLLRRNRLIRLETLDKIEILDRDALEQAADCAA